MSVYMIIETETKNRVLYSQYVEKVPAIVEKYRGRYLVRTRKVTPLTGDWKPERIIVIEFPSAEHLRKCFDSTEYREIAPLRGQSTVARSVMVDGYPVCD